MATIRQRLQRRRLFRRKRDPCGLFRCCWDSLTRKERRALARNPDHPLRRSALFRGCF